MYSRNRIISPKRTEPYKVQIRYPCPGIYRFAGMVSFLIVSVGLYYAGTWLFGLKPLIWAAPAWTTKHVILITVCIIFGLLAALIGSAVATTIEVRSERINNLFIILWQYLANTSLIWMTGVGLAMTISLGQQAAKVAVIQFGMERAVFHVIGTGCVLGLIIGIVRFLSPIIRIPFLVFFAFTVTITLLAAKWHFDTYGIQGKSWIAAGIIIPFLLQIFTPPMILRDHKQRQLLMEQS